MEFFNKFGVPWLDRSFGEALQDDSLVELFGAVSDSLGPLLRGSYDTDVKQMILINLLGPAFICKHFRFLLLEKKMFSTITFCKTIISNHVLFNFFQKQLLELTQM